MRTGGSHPATRRSTSGDRSLPWCGWKLCDGEGVKVRMSGKEIHFIGLLANTDSSILQVPLDHGFRIHAMSKEDGVRLLSNFECLPPMRSYRILMEYSLLSENKLYYIDNSFETDIEMGNDGALTDFPLGMGEFGNNLVRGYLDPAIRLMRLFKEGNICIPLEYCYFIDSDTPKTFVSKDRSLHVSPVPYTLKSSEIPDLQEFIQNTELPFKESSLQSAFGRFELSYQIRDRNTSFLSLMISLEALLNPDRSEVTHRVSRNTAVLLGKDKEDSRTIFSEIKDLYKKRSKIVHTGNSNSINEEDLLKLRHYVRESIKEISKIGDTKDELSKMLDSLGFGERPWIK